MIGALNYQTNVHALFLMKSVDLVRVKLASVIALDLDRVRGAKDRRNFGDLKNSFDALEFE